MKSELQNVSITYIGESKRSWKSGGRGPEHKPGTNGNVGSAVKQHAETSGHDRYTLIMPAFWKQTKKPMTKGCS